MPDFSKMTEEEIKKFLSTADEKQTADFLIWKTKEEVKKELKNEFPDINKVEELIKEKMRLEKRLDISPNGKEDEAKLATVEWIKAKTFGNPIDPIVKKYPEHFKQITTASAPALVPTYFLAELIKDFSQVAWHRQYCRVIPVPSSSGTYPVLGTGVTAYRVAEGVAPTPSDPTFGQATFSTYELAARVYVSDKLIEVAGIDIVNALIELLAEAIAQKEFVEIAVGTGTNQFKGLASEELTQIEGTALDYDLFVDAFTTIKPEDRANAVWISNSTMFASAFKLKDTSGRPYFDLLQEKVFGKPFLTNDNFTADEIYFGNLKAYYIFDQRNYRLDIERGGEALRSKRLVMFIPSVDNDGKLTRTQAFCKIVITSQ